jgi:hypothetical protein
MVGRKGGKEMSTIKLLSTLVLACLAGTRAAPVYALQTLIDLKKDGRVISGPRKDFLKLGARQYRDAARNKGQTPALAIKLGDSLSNKIINSEIAAIVVPEGMTGGRYLIGLLIGESTLPEDFPVEEQDFLYLRSYAKKDSLAAIERSYYQIKSALANGGREVQAKLADLHNIVFDFNAQKGNEGIGLFAGYLLSELTGPSAVAESNEFVAAYRTEYERSVDKTVQQAIREGKLAWFQPVDVASDGFVFTVADLSGSTRITRRAAKEGECSYLRIWHGGSLIVVPEQPGIDTGYVKMADLPKYFRTYNPSVHIDTVIRKVDGSG